MTKNKPLFWGKYSINIFDEDIKMKYPNLKIREVAKDDFEGSIKHLFFALTSEGFLKDKKGMFNSIGFEDAILKYKKHLFEFLKDRVDGTNQTLIWRTRPEIKCDHIYEGNEIIHADGCYIFSRLIITNE